MNNNNKNIIDTIISNLPLHNNKAIAVCIAGESGCGKTTLSQQLAAELMLRNVSNIILHQDDYFILPPKQNHQKRVENFDHIGMQEVALDSLDADIETIKLSNAKQLKIPVMNWQKDVKEYTTIEIKNIQVVIVEGTYSNTLRNGDYKIFMSANHFQTKQNRLNRNRENIDHFIEQVLIKESEIIQSQKAFANMIIDHNFSITQI